MSGDPASWTTDLDDADAAHGAGGDLDVVEAQPRRLGRRGRRVLAVVVAAVVAIGGAAWYADGRSRAHEFDQLLACVSTAEAARAGTERRVAAMASYVRPSLTVFGAYDLELYGIIAREAAYGRPEFDAAVRGCDTVNVLSIHRSLERARSQYLAYLSAESAHLGAIATDGSHAYDDTDELQALRNEAFAALSAAAPDDDARRELATVARVDQ